MSDSLFGIMVLPENTIRRTTQGNPPIRRTTFLNAWIGTDRIPAEGWAMTAILLPFYGETTVNAVSIQHAREHRLFQRVFIACPCCRERQPLGRLHQHYKSKRCLAIANEP